MNPVFRSAAVCVLAAGGFAWLNMKSEQDFERMAAHYDLNPAEIEFARTCMSSLSRYDKEFIEGTASYVGCGCIASNLASDGQDVNYQVMASGFTSIIKFSGDDGAKPTAVTDMLQDMTTAQGMSYPEALDAVTELGRATEACKGAKVPRSSPKMNAVGSSNSIYQPTVTDAPANGNRCAGLSADAVATLQKIADRDGKTLEQVCANVIS